ncbi:60S ribosomal protein L35 [Purpureocillium lavendulum]|uniref:60S ribosomal protein L35 n=1 Tax=Purpureocillium lavendulum TaxID=1247861 RepID=A0AB34G4Z6_9HYPO|nr:60S ribosomal protein L35 [Purpureocillium lavendulum]
MVSPHAVQSLSHCLEDCFSRPPDFRIAVEAHISSGKVKAVQLWDKSKDDLTKQLSELKTELGQLRIQKVASSGSKLNKMVSPTYSHDLRKSIARVLTVINAKQRSQLRLFYKNKKYAPLDLRPKQTRAIRRRLSPEDKARVLEKTKKRSTHFPQRKYAIKA